MRSLKSRVAGFVILGSALFSGGCIDAVGDGFAAGVNDGIATVIADLIIGASEGLGGDEATE
jgi:hypothetical protein